MASKRSLSKKSSHRDTPQIMNFFQVNGMTYSLGDIRKADFSALGNPKASVKSIQDWAIQLSNILRGFELDESDA